MKCLCRRARCAVLALVALLLVNLPGCNRPSKEDCEKAIANIRHLAGTADDDFGNPASAIRSCRGNASKNSVNCVIAAQSIPELEACEGGIFDEMFKDEIEAAKKKKDEEKKDEEKKDEKPDGKKRGDAPKPGEPAKPDVKKDEAAAPAAPAEAAKADEAAKAGEAKKPDNKEK